MEACETTHRIYCDLVEKLMVKVGEQYPDEPKTSQRKMARQAARSVLPNATETKIFVTSNARALRHFIEMRAHAAAEVEIRKLAVAVLRLMQAESPNLFSDYEIITLPDGTEAARTEHRKV
jgi:thymidylate synthase (FAD)